MAQLRLEPPVPFNFRTPDDWPRWKRRFEQFRVASGLVSDGEVKQVNTLLYCIGEEAEAVLTSTNATEEDREVHDTVVAKFDAFFRVRRNVIFERARFYRRSQLVGESAEQFIMELYTLAEHCNYGDMTDEMIRDRLVVGVQDATLSQLLQLDAELTLEKAKKWARQREAVAEQQQALKGAARGAITLDGIHSRHAQVEQQLAGDQMANLARAVAKVNTPMTDVPQRKQPATDAKRRGTTVRNAFPSKTKTRKYPEQITSTPPSWTQSHQAIQDSDTIPRKGDVA